MLTCVEICAGAGGQALGLHMAGFQHVALIEYEQEYCDVLKKNMPEWNVICMDVHKLDGYQYAGTQNLGHSRMQGEGAVCDPTGN